MSYSNNLKFKLMSKYRISLLFLSFLLLLVLNNSVFSQGFVDPQTPVNVKPQNDLIGSEWKLDFSDEFNDAAVNSTKWNIDNSTSSRAARPNIGINSWFWRPTNVSQENGNLVLKVYKSGTNSMTNGSINSRGKYETMYGYFEARIKIGDASKGTHTAFWLQGPNMGNVDGTANDGAEIDIFESAWTGEYTKSVVHIDGYADNHQANTMQYNTPGIHSGFHTWGFHWTENFMSIYYDGVKKVTYGSGSNYKWVVRALEYLWLSNGASFGLTGDQYFLDFPIGYLTETHVDYIRVWKPSDNTAVENVLDLFSVQTLSNGKVLKYSITNNVTQSIGAKVFDVNGKCMYDNQINSLDREIIFDTALRSGVYFLIINDIKQSKSIKFIVA